MKDATATMGAVLPDDVGGRDAVHVAVVAVKAGHDLAPGQAVKIKDTQIVGDYTAVADMVGIGIVDPYIVGMVPKDQRFWLFLHPRSITSLKHQWTHPAFEDTDAMYDAPAKKLASEKWLREFVTKADCPSYEALVAGAVDNWDNEYLHFDGRDAHGEIPPEFWDHIEVVTGQKITQERRAPYFSCSC